MICLLNISCELVKVQRKQTFNLKSASTTQRLLNTQPVFFTVDQTFRIMIE